MKIHNALRLLLAPALMFGFSQELYAVPIDLNDFFADPTVTVTPDGSFASITEDPGLSAVLLSNDPGLGDPNVIIPGLGVLLSFDFSFNEAGGELDEFGSSLELLKDGPQCGY